MEKNINNSIEQDLHNYIEELKKTSLAPEELKKAILRVKKALDTVLDCCKQDIADGDISKEQLLKDFLEQYKQDIKAQPHYQSSLATLSTDNDACKKIMKLEKTNKMQFDSFIKNARQKEYENPEEKLFHSVNLNDEIMTILRVAIKNAKSNKSNGSNSSLKQEDIINAIYGIKNTVSSQIRALIYPSLQQSTYFLDEFGYLDEIIEKTNNILAQNGLSGLQQAKRNSIPEKVYDGQGNKINLEESEDLGVLDMFTNENLEKLSLDDLLILDLCWREQYLRARLDISEALNTIDFLDLWPTLLNENEEAINNIDNQKLNIALKRDICLTYLIRRKQALTPELQDRYVNFLESNGMAQKESTYEEIEKQSKELEGCFKIADDLLISECIIIDKLINKDLATKNWGIIDKNFFDDLQESEQDKLIFGIEMPSFRGPLILGIKSEYLCDFVKAKNSTSQQPNLSFPKYKGNIDENYSQVMSTLLLPNSNYFKKYVTEKYKKNPDSKLYEQLATTFAGSKKIKHKSKDKEGTCR